MVPHRRGRSVYPSPDWHPPIWSSQGHRFRGFGRVLSRIRGSGPGGSEHWFFDSINRVLVVLKTIFYLFLAPSPGGSRGRVRTLIFRRESYVLGRFRPGSGG